MDMQNLITQINTALDKLNQPHSLTETSKILKTVSALCLMHARMVDDKIEEQAIEFGSCEINSP